ncbi:hypothetical protein ACFRJ1_15715 [Streptomyces sp. NPDC056773]|uniref:hypothetical protein n=1 Tax=unclassified Streptomyces TaxID=2593676 RepID=UPI0036B5BDC9
MAAQARYPEFGEQRALQQLLMSDLAHRITANHDLGWLLIGSLTWPARPVEDGWPADFRAPGIGDVPQPYVMARSAFDLDLCASAVTDPNPDQAAREYRQVVEGELRRVAAAPGHVGTAHGIGFGGLVRYTAGSLNVFPNGQVMGVVMAQPIDPRFGPRRTPPVDDPIPIEIDIKPPSKVIVTGGPDTALRPVAALRLQGFTPFQPLMNPAVNALADKLVLLTGAPAGLREGPDGPWHRYKDIYDAYFVVETCHLDADRMREAVNKNWNLARMGIDRVSVPYRFYGQDASGPEPAVPWKEGMQALRDRSPQLDRYPSWEHMRDRLGTFMDSVQSAPSGSTWIPGQGWKAQLSRAAGEGDQQGSGRGVSASAARRRSTTTTEGSRGKPSAPRGTRPAAPGGASPQEERRRGRGRG